MRFNKIKSRGLFLALIVLLGAFHSTEANAQGKASLVKGVVQNSKNEPLAGVSVVVRNTSTNFTSGTSTDSTGTFSFSRIASGGPYSFTFSNVGYEPQTLSGYNIKDDISLSL